MTHSPQTVLVTGGAGFIGSHLCGALLARGDRVICLDNFNDYYDPAFKRANITSYESDPSFLLVEGDIRDRELVTRLFAEHGPQRVAHLAAMAGVRYSIERAPLYVDVNLQGTVTLLDAAREHMPENFVFASTSSVYGATQDIPFQESQPTDESLAPYPATKKAAEVMGHAFHNMFGLNFTALRFFTVYGPRNRPDMMAYRTMEAIVSGQPITLFNNGEMHRDWTYVDDIVQGVVGALDTPLGYAVLNIGRGQPVHLGEFVSIIEELVGRPAQIISVPAPVSEPLITYADTSKAEALFDYHPQTSIREGLAHTWAWYQQHRQPLEQGS